MSLFRLSGWWGKFGVAGFEFSEGASSELET